MTEKEPMFTKYEFDNAQYAMDVKEKLDSKLPRLKIGLIAAAITQFFFFFMALGDFEGNLEKTLIYIWMILTLATFIIAGELISAIKRVFGFAIALGKKGFDFPIIPINLGLGLVGFLIPLEFLPTIYIVFPLLYMFLAYRRNRKECKEAEEYLSYCKPVGTAYNNEANVE